MTNDRVPMTQEGYEKKKAELVAAESKMLEITKRVAAAREMGDLSENAEYHAAREDQGMQQAEINRLQSELARAYICDPSTLPNDEVVFGSRVTIKDLDIDEEEDFTLVGPGQENPDQNRILTSSPIGQGLLGKKKGEVAEIAVPAGTIRFEILDIQPGEM